MYTKLGEALEDSVRRSCQGKNVAVAFSGGIDSGLIAAAASKYADSVTLYTCGTDNAFDVRSSKELAGKLGLPWVHCRIGKGNIEESIRDFCRRTSIRDPFTISYDLQLYCVCREAEEGIVLTGQGSDEYFGGTAKLVGKTDKEYRALLDAGVDRLMNVSVPVERRVAASFGKGLHYPFLDEEVIRQISLIDPEEIRPREGGSLKPVLRKTVADMGYPLLSGRVKKASQYGSGTTDLIRSMAKSGGMWYNQYVEGLADEALQDRGESVLTVRVDADVKSRAEAILASRGITPSEAVENLYREIIGDGE